MQKFLPRVLPTAFCLLITLIGCWLWLFGDPVYRWKLRNVSVGMSLTEVEALLGPGEDIEWTNFPGTPLHPSQAKYWADDDIGITVWFDRDGRVMDKWITGVYGIQMWQDQRPMRTKLADWVSHRVPFAIEDF